ncbi:MAG TPA: hypothetical protein VI197_13230 [Polyangiaceae bacterium]
MTRSGRLRAFVALVLLGAGSAGAEGGLGGTFSCPQRETAGRVVCDLDLPKRSGDSTLVWVDALVLKAPPFLRPLRSRVTVPVARGGAHALNLPVAFVAQELGRAEISVRARAVVCRQLQPAPSGCRALQADFTASIRVGP